jgi:cyanophycin synthetase
MTEENMKELQGGAPMSSGIELNTDCADALIQKDIQKNSNINKNRQKHLRFDLTFDPTMDGASHANVQRWLIILDDDLHELHGFGSDADALDVAKHWLLMTLRLSRLLLQLIRVPAFDEPQVLSCHKVEDGSDNWTAEVSMPGAEFVAKKNCAQLLRFAFDMTKWMAAADVDKPIDRGRFFLILQERMIQPNAKLMPPGKSTFEVLKAAYREGIPFMPLTAGYFVLGWGSHSRKINRSTTDHDAVIGMRLAQNKYSTANMLANAGLPTPVHHLVLSYDEAVKASEKVGHPLVVKPVDMERGEGVFVDVTKAQLQEVFSQAQQASPSKQVLVEKQIAGVCHRLFICAGRLLYAVKRLPIGVYADGQSTIAQLVNQAWQQQEMLPPWKRSGLKPLDDMAMNMLVRQGYGVGSIAPAGQFVALRRIETSAWGGVDEEVTHSLHPENLKIALAAANIFGLEVAGIDIMSPDITKPWFDNGAVINEVNFAPLLGGGEISRRYLQEYLDRIVPNKGRIKVEVFVGGAAAWQAAQAHWQSVCKTGVAAFMTSANETLDAQGHSLRLAQQGLNARLLALISRREVQALVVVVQTLELLTMKPVLHRVDAVQMVDDEITVDTQKLIRASYQQVMALFKLCKKWTD